MRNTDPPLLQEREVRYSTLHILCMSMACLGNQAGYAALFALVDPMMATFSMSGFAKFISWSLGPLAGLIVQPIIGYYSDRCHAKLGRRRPFILTGGIIAAVCILLLFILKLYAEKLSVTLISVFLLIIVGVAYSGLNIQQGAARSLLGDIVPKNQQDLAYSLSSALFGFGSILANLIGGIGYFIESYQGNTETITLISCSCIMIVSVIITMVSAKEEQFVGDVEKANVFKTLFKALIHMSKPVQRAAFVLTASSVGYYPIMIRETSVFSSDIFPQDQYNKGLCFGLFVTALTSMVTFLYGLVDSSISRKIGMKAAYFISHLIMTVCLFSTFFTRNQWVLLGLFTLIGIPNCVYNSIPFTITSASSKLEERGVNLGVLNIFCVVGEIIANILNLIYSLIHDKWAWFNSHVGKNQAYIAFGFVGGLVATIGAFALIVPNPDEYEEIQEDSAATATLATSDVI